MRFATRFLVLAGVLFAVYAFPYREVGISEDWLEAYLRGYARVVGVVLHSFEPNVQVVGTSIIGRFSLRIVKSCDAIEINILFTAALLAFPGPWKRKLVALIAGLAMLALCNLLRLQSLYYVGVYYPKAFEFMHIEVWPLLLVGCALAVFLLCVRWLSRAGRLSLV